MNNPLALLRMWRDVAWMTRCDREILEFLYELGDYTVDTATIARNIEYNPNYVSTRLQDLASTGLVDRIERGWYTQSDLGRAFCEGRMSPDDVPQPPD